MAAAKPHRQNSDFQLRHFLVGNCSTPDGAYVLMYGQLIDMQSKLRHAEAQIKAREAKLKAAEAKAAKAQQTLEIASYEIGELSPYARLQAEAYILQAEATKLEIEADIPMWEMNRQAAQQELAAIEALMLDLRSQCKYADLPILEMSEKSQEDEWLGQLKRRAENFLITAGTIPHDHFQTMRMHPKFNIEILPHITRLQNKVDQIGRTANYSAGTSAGPQSRWSIAEDLATLSLLEA